MFSPMLFLIATYLTAAGGDKALQSTDTMMGLNAVHDTNIDKDTIITRHENKLKLTKRGRTSAKNEGAPDWSYSTFPEEVKNDVIEFKRNMSECLKEVQASDQRQVRRLSPNRESPVHGECLIACVLKRNGVILNGKINKGNLLSLIKKFYAKDEKLIKKLEKNLDRCIESSARSKNDCTIAARLNECTNGLMANNKHKITVNY